MPRKVHSAETKGRQEEGKVEPGTREVLTSFLLDGSNPGARRVTHRAHDSFALPAKKVSVPSSVTSCEPSASIITTNEHELCNHEAREQNPSLSCFLGGIFENVGVHQLILSDHNFIDNQAEDLNISDIELEKTLGT